MDEKTLLSDSPMICPKCGAEMNHHAMKVDYAAEEPSGDESIYDGALQEVYTCPHCGDIELRRAN